MITINNKIYRNLEEQVQYLTNYHEVNQGLAQWGIRVIGQVDTVEELNAIDTSNLEYGDAVAVGTESPFFFYIWTRASIEGGNAYWFPFGEISTIGPQGPQGIQGPKGDTGEAAKWYAGNELPPAVSSNYIEGDMYLNTSVGLVFRFQNGVWSPMINITGPQGAQGVRGPQGERGLQGVQGIQGPRGLSGTWVNVVGKLSVPNQLPSPASVNNLTYAYLVGSTDNYKLYVQVGTSPANAYWESAGIINEIDVDMYVKSTTQTNRVYVHDHEKDTTIGYTTSAQGGTFPVRDWDGNIYLPTDIYRYTENSAVSKSYVDSKAAGIYQHKIIVKNSVGSKLTFSFLCKFKTTAFTDIEDLKMYLTLPSIAGVMPAVFSDGGTSTMKGGSIISVVDSGTNSVALQFVSDASSLFIANELNSDVVIEL